jgi:hypothetical protein
MLVTALQQHNGCFMGHIFRSTTESHMSTRLNQIITQFCVLASHDRNIAKVINSGIFPSSVVLDHHTHFSSVL